MNTIVTGATGMIGGLVLNGLLANERVARVTTVGRRSTGIGHDKLVEVEHADFLDLGSISQALTGNDAAFFCLGAYTGAVPDSEFKKITVDYAVAFSDALRALSPESTLCFLSGQGADRNERSRMSFARYKGEAENALIRAGYPRLHLFRPGYIYPSTPRDEPNLSYRVMRALWPLARRVYPNLGVASDDLARAMITAGLEGTPQQASHTLENRDIRALAASVA